MMSPPKVLSPTTTAEWVNGVPTRMGTDPAKALHTFEAQVENVELPAMQSGASKYPPGVHRLDVSQGLMDQMRRVNTDNPYGQQQTLGPRTFSQTDMNYEDSESAFQSSGYGQQFRRWQQ
jgi:hypothetical protein